MTNIDRYKQLMDLFSLEDFSAVRDMVHPDIETENFAPDNTPIAGNRKGIEDFMNYMITAGTQTAEYEFLTSSAWFEQADHVVALGRERYTVKSTGKVAETAFAHESKWKDGKLIFWREYYDSAKMQAAYEP